jgi:hypothetical protein
MVRGRWVAGHQWAGATTGSKELAARLRNASAKKGVFYAAVYDDLYRRVLTIRSGEKMSNDEGEVALQMLAFDLFGHQDHFSEIGPGDCSLSLESPNTKQVYAVDVSAEIGDDSSGQISFGAIR